MNSDSPSVSVCLVTYNRGTVLSATLDSILRQTFAEFELIISDDSSTDSTEQVCRDYAKRDSRIKYFRNEENLGMPGNLNLAISRARGEYIANLHDGDIYRKDLLEKWIASLRKYPNAAFVFNYYEQLDVQGTPTGKIWRKYDADLVPGEMLIKDIMKGRGSPVWGTVMARRIAYDRIGRFDDRFGHIADVDMWLRMATSYDAAHVPEPLISIRAREDNHPWSKMKWQNIEWEEDILYTNMVRMYGQPGGSNRAVWGEFFRRWDTGVVRWFFTDLFPSWLRVLLRRSNRSKGSIKEGLAFLRNSRSPRLAAASKILSMTFLSPDCSDGK